MSKPILKRLPLSTPDLNTAWGDCLYWKFLVKPYTAEVTLVVILCTF